MNKAVMILVDGMRPDAMLQCGHPFVKELLSESSYTLKGRTVEPSVTLPCHVSLFHSVDPARHGITTNTYVPQVRPIRGLFDRLSKEKKKCAFFYSWEQLRDLCRPGRLHTSLLLNINRVENADEKLTEKAVEYLKAEAPDFLFLYLGETDEFGGHGGGWMSEEYLQCIYTAFECIQKVKESLGEEYTLIVLADHGGHDRTHGTLMNEDMTIPVILYGKHFAPGKELPEVSIKDIAPTVAKLLGTEREEEWEGKELY